MLVLSQQYANHTLEIQLMGIFSVMMFDTKYSINSRNFAQVCLCFQHFGLSDVFWRTLLLARRNEERLLPMRLLVVAFWAMFL